MSDAPEIITVDVKGAVKQPGVYELRSDSRVHDAIHKAGGMTADANSQSVNLAQKLSDEAVIYVAKEGEDVPALGSSESPATSSASAEKTGKVHLNRASESELQTVSGIGQKRAQDIIAYRDANGPFRSVDDLKNVSGIGEKTLEKLEMLSRWIKELPFSLVHLAFLLLWCILVFINHLGFDQRSSSGDMFSDSSL